MSFFFSYFCRHLKTYKYNFLVYIFQKRLLKVKVSWIYNKKNYE